MSDPKVYYVAEGKVCVVLGGRGNPRSYIQVRTPDGTFETVAESRLSRDDIDTARRCEERFLAGVGAALEARAQCEHFEDLEIGDEFLDMAGRKHRKIDTDKALTDPEGPWVTLPPEAPVRRFSESSSRNPGPSGSAR